MRDRKEAETVLWLVDFRVPGFEREKVVISGRQSALQFRVTQGWKWTGSDKSIVPKLFILQMKKLDSREIILPKITKLNAGIA